ncbi:MAG: hypothetical protein FP814_01390 [Desulfobacterium sp.]|nr:hypothetical protein [Desulfobacterium sp.]MBU3948994.1 hypothetical protein [Pseudomonadota bacterium]MBU4034969.1 hypothetical protein [Pseudomonadota bacterium]
MSKKIFSEILFGVLIILFGTLIYFDTSPSIYGFPVPKSLGGFLIILGFFWVFYALLNKKKLITTWKKAKEVESIWICPQCLKPEYRQDNPDLKCRVCHTNLEDLDGFYERNPELKENKKI